MACASRQRSAALAALAVAAVPGAAGVDWAPGGRLIMLPLARRPQWSGADGLTARTRRTARELDRRKPSRETSSRARHAGHAARRPPHLCVAWAAALVGIAGRVRKRPLQLGRGTESRFRLSTRPWWRAEARPWAAAAIGDAVAPQARLSWLARLQAALRTQHKTVTLRRTLQARQRAGWGRGVIYSVVWGWICGGGPCTRARGAHSEHTHWSHT